MQSLFFWKNWNRTSLFLLLNALILLGVGLGAATFFYGRGIHNIVRWDVLSELDEIPTVLSTYQNAPLLGKAYLVKEQFVASVMAVHEWASWLYLTFILAGLALILSAVSVLPRLWYAISMTVVIGILTASRLEILQLFGLSNSLGLGVVLVSVGVLSYYLHAFRSDMSVEQRVYLFVGLLVGLLVLFHFSSHTTLPALTVTSYSLLSVTVLSLVFIGWLSVEIVAGFVYVTTNSRTGFGKKSLNNYLFLSVLYLISVALVYLKNTRRFDGDLWVISPIVLLLVSMVLGLWSFQKRTADRLPFREVGVWLYSGLALVTLGALSYALATNNNPLIEVFEDTVVYGQLGLGTLFVLYTGLNFWPYFQKGQAVHKIIYKPLRFAQWQMWAIGGMIAVSLMTFDRFFIVSQARAGHYNALGDLYTAKREYVVAEEYYKLALTEDFQNHKSNYALASLALTQGDNSTAGAYFRQALLKNPSPQAYAGLSRAMLDENLFFDAIFNLRTATKAFPNNGQLANNLGYLYGRTNIADSTFYYFDIARNTLFNSDVADANLLAFWAKNPDLSESNQESFEPKSYPAYEANRLALSNKAGDKSNALPASQFQIKLPSDSALSVNNFAYLYNYAQLTQTPTLLPLLRRLSEKEVNGTFYDELQMARAYQEYLDDKIVAFDRLAQLTVADTSKKVAVARQTLTYWINKEVEIAQKENTAGRTDWLEQLKQAPFNVGLLRRATEHFNQQKQPKVAYQAILNALRFRRDSPEILKLYILQCLEMRLIDFAQTGLNDLFAIAPSADYEAFRKTYQTRLAAVEQERVIFGTN
jgi:Flp pilus assembly protein TadD